MRSFIFLKKQYNSLTGAPDEKGRMFNKFLSLHELLSPLPEITTKGALEDLLRGRAPRFRQLKTELEGLFWREQSGKLYEDVREVTLAKTDLLGEESLQRFLGAIDSAEAFSNWVIETSEQGPRALYRLAALNQQAGEPALYADMCIDALSGVLTDLFTRWTPEAIPLLAEAADEYMTTVEDVFLGEPSSTHEPGERVDYESLRKDLGL